MNAIEFLIKEHNKVRSLFSDLENPSHRVETKRKIYDTLYSELVRHETMEQSVWYPELKANKELYSVIKHLLSEEKDAKKLMDRLNKIKNTDTWDTELTRLKEDVEHHASEEENELFPEVSHFYDKPALERIGKEMRDFKQKYVS